MALRLLAIVCLLLSAVHAQEEGGEGEGGGEEENGRVKKKIKIINTMLSTVVNHSAQLYVEITDSKPIACWSTPCALGDSCQIDMQCTPSSTKSS